MLETIEDPQNMLEIHRSSSGRETSAPRGLTTSGRNLARIGASCAGSRAKDPGLRSRGAAQSCNSSDGEKEEPLSSRLVHPRGAVHRPLTFTIRSQPVQSMF